MLVLISVGAITMGMILAEANSAKAKRAATLLVAAGTLLLMVALGAAVAEEVFHAG